MKLKYIVNETGNPIEVLIPYHEFRLLEPLFSLLSEDNTEISKPILPTDLSNFFIELNKIKPFKIPNMNKVLQEIREDRF